jgi:hypothetical protein
MYNFGDSYNDYKYLMERGFSEKSSLKLVGDRYRLTRIGRNALFRGVVEESKASARMAKIITPDEASGKPMGIDWYNVLITVESYLRGALVFLADDGMLRDSSAVHGSFRSSPLTQTAIKDIIETVRTLAPGRVDAYLDSPIAHSAVMAEKLRECFASELGVPSEAGLSRSADFPLKTYDGIIASSDSVILDAAAKIFDLPRCILRFRYSFTPLPLRSLDRLDPGGSGRLFESENPSQ